MIPEEFLKLALAVLFGAIIGFEREYSSKAAGFRTITMITLGSTLFTILSFKIGSVTDNDHIAANIITGIGFIGAGVIFKDGLSVSGLTTAATIWVAAAMGMAIGAGEFLVAAGTLVLSMVVLALLEKAEGFIGRFHQVRIYRINFSPDYAAGKNKVEEYLKRLNIAFKIKKILQTGEEVSFFFNISGNEEKLNQFSTFLIDTNEVKSFEE